MRIVCISDLGVSVATVVLGLRLQSAARRRAPKEVGADSPRATNVLITHGPPQGSCDRMGNGTNVGCEELALAVERVRPYLHVCGHIHDGYGVQGATVNVAVCSNDYDVVNRPVVVDLDGTGLRGIEL